MKDLKIAAAWLLVSAAAAFFAVLYSNEGLATQCRDNGAITLRGETYSCSPQTDTK